MGVDELTARAKTLRDQNNYAEAVLVAREATRTDPENANAWWQLGLAIQGHQGLKKALDAFSKTTELAPSFGPGWLRLGMAEEESGLKEEAKVSFRLAFEKDADLTIALDKLAELSTTTSDDDEAFWALERLSEVGNLSGSQCNRLGILYHNKGAHAQAVHFYRRAAAELEDPAGWINLGLVLSNEAVGQDCDAVDALRHGQRLYPEKERFKTMLDSLVPRLIALANSVRARPTPVLTVEEQYQHYVSPIDLLELGDEDLDEIGAKEIQRAKRKLLHEIELEDGEIDWMEGIRIDRSRALAICDEIISDSDTFRYHALVYGDLRLQGFLTRGQLEHFLVRAVDEERDTERALADEYDDFGSWLSPIFAAQFNLVLAKAIAQKEMKVIECLLGGRRWVQPKDEDGCFVLARRIIARLIDDLDDTCKRVEKEKLTPEQVKAALARGQLGRLLEMLPSTFSEERSKTFFVVRGVAIGINNVHDDPSLALVHLDLARPLAKKSPHLKHTLDTDEAKLKELKAEADKHACRLSWLGKPLEITRTGARFGDTVIAVEQVSSLKWGATINVGGRREMARYQITISGAGREITVDWTAQESKQQDDYFAQMTIASVVYLMDSCIANLRKSVAGGQRIQIGSTVATREGLVVKITGLFRIKEHTIAWDDLRGTMKGGIINLTDRTNSKATVALTGRDTDNAITLYWIARKNED